MFTLPFRQNNTFEATKQVCAILEIGVAAIFGPQSSSLATHIQSMCDAMEVPHFETRWKRGQGYKLWRSGLTISLHPDYEDLMLHYISLVKYFNWTSFIIIYEESDGLIRLQDFFKESITNKWKIQLYQLHLNDQSPRKVFRDIRISFLKKPKEDICILLDVPAKKIYEVFKAAQQVEMMTVRNKYIVTSLDLHTVNLEEFMHSRTNITGLSLVQKSNPDYRDALDRITKRMIEHKQEEIKHLTLASALMYDAVNLFAWAIKEVDNVKHIGEIPGIDCNSLDSKGSDGSSIINYIKAVDNYDNGLTGPIRFNIHGLRSELCLDVLQLTRDSGLEKIGETTLIYKNSKKHVSLSITEQVYLDEPLTGLEHKKYIITTKVQDPYVMLKNSKVPLSGNDIFEGYVVDLMRHLAEFLNFQYELTLVKDGRHGEDHNGTWDGMIGEVIRHEAHMAIADISISAAREKVVEFTLPFMTTGIGILLRKPTEKSTSLFSFMAPFSFEVWIYILVIHLALTLIIFFVGRLSPYEWEKPFPCRQDGTIEENPFSLGNSLWFLLASFMQEGSEIEPRSLSTRTVAGSWYFFTMIIISSYTAKMASFLTVEKVIYPISSVYDLDNQTKIEFGCTKGGSTRAFFEKSNDVIYKRLWAAMSKNESRSLMKDNKTAMKRVQQSDYAFFMEATSIQYFVQTECNLTQIGGLLDSKGYGIAVSKGDTLLSSWLSSGILHLEEEGVLSVLQQRWWKHKKQKPQCKDASSSAVGGALKLNNVGGVFLVLLVGVMFGALVACVEFLWKFQKRAECKDLVKMMAKEIKFAVACSKPVKEVYKLPKLQKSSSRIMEIIGSKISLYKR